MHRSVLAAVAAVTLVVAGSASSAHAASIGTATGDLVVHYNGAGPEIPSNVSYVSTSNTTFNFDQGLAFPFPGYGPQHFFQAVANQFQFNLVFNLPTNTGAAPSPVQASNGNTHGTVQTVDVDWAISDPSYGTIGNSPFRGGTGAGSSVAYTQTVTPTATGFHMDLIGSLATDGLIHWASAAGGNGNGTTNLSDPLWSVFLLPNDGHFYFKGSFDYVIGRDTTPGADVYSGSIAFDTTPYAGTAVPMPAAAPAGAALLAGLAVAKRRRAARNV